MTIQAFGKSGDELKGPSSKLNMQTIKTKGTDPKSKEANMSNFFVLKILFPFFSSSVIGKTPKHFENAQNGFTIEKMFFMLH